jgi:hypothetical protein
MRLKRIAAREIAEANIQPNLKPLIASADIIKAEAIFASVLDTVIKSDALEFAFSTIDPNTDIPFTLAEALLGSDGHHWKHALEEEL